MYMRCIYLEGVVGSGNRACFCCSLFGQISHSSSTEESNLVHKYFTVGFVLVRRLAAELAVWCKHCHSSWLAWVQILAWTLYRDLNSHTHACNTMSLTSWSKGLFYFIFLRWVTSIQLQGFAFYNTVALPLLIQEGSNGSGLIWYHWNLPCSTFYPFFHPSIRRLLGAMEDVKLPSSLPSGLS